MIRRIVKEECSVSMVHEKCEKCGGTLVSGKLLSTREVQFTISG